MNVELQVTINPRLARGLAEHADILKTNIEAGLEAVGQYITGVAQERSPIDTSRLRRSIGWQRTDYVVQIGSNVKYARIHEYGGEIRPRNARFLVFKIGDRTIFAKRVRIREKRYLRGALEEGKDKAAEIMNKAVENAIQECGLDQEGGV